MLSRWSWRARRRSGNVLHVAKRLSRFSMMFVLLAFPARVLHATTINAAKIPSRDYDASFLLLPFPQPPPSGTVVLVAAVYGSRRELFHASRVTLVSRSDRGCIKANGLSAVQKMHVREMQKRGGKAGSQGVGGDLLHHL